jgi:hypothetical protein
MEYDLNAIAMEVEAIEERAKRLKELGIGIEAIERNAEAILAFVYALKKNVSDIID